MLKVFNIAGSAVTYSVNGIYYKFHKGITQHLTSNNPNLYIRITNVPRQVFDDVAATNLRCMPVEYLTDNVLTGVCGGKVYVNGVFAFYV